jgi:hypothetical protein
MVDSILKVRFYISVIAFIGFKPNYERILIAY